MEPALLEQVLLLVERVERAERVRRRPEHLWLMLLATFMLLAAQELLLLLEKLEMQELQEPEQQMALLDLQVPQVPQIEVVGVVVADTRAAVEINMVVAQVVLAW